MEMETYKKHLKRLIYILLLIKVSSQEERRTIFGKILTFLVLWYFYSECLLCIRFTHYCADSIGNEEQLQLLRRGVWPIISNVVIENLLT